MSGYDLHTHSNNSDGIYPPAEVVRRAKEAGLDGIALTDHDSLAGLPEAYAAGKLHGVEVLLGCEISATFEHQPVHMLGYFMDPANPRLIAELQEIRESRIGRAERMVRKLNELGVPITYERVRELAAGESVGRPHIATAMVEAGVIKRRDDAFTDDWIGNNGRAYLEKTALSPEAAIELVNEAGGVAVIAHPVWLKTKSIERHELIRELARAGMGGIEVDHPDHDEEMRRHFGALAEELGLVATASSDFHGDEHGGVIGSNRCARETVDLLRERCATPRR